MPGNFNTLIGLHALFSKIYAKGGWCNPSSGGKWRLRGPQVYPWKAPYGIGHEALPLSKGLKWLLDKKHVAALHFQDSEWATARWKEASDERFGAGHHDISIHFLRTGGSHEDIQNHSEPQKSMGYKIMFQFFKWSAGCRLGAIEATPSNNSHSSLGLRNKAIDNWVAFVAM